MMLKTPFFAVRSLPFVPAIFAYGSIVVLYVRPYDARTLVSFRSTLLAKQSPFSTTPSGLRWAPSITVIPMPKPSLLFRARITQKSQK